MEINPYYNGTAAILALVGKKLCNDTWTPDCTKLIVDYAKENQKEKMPVKNYVNEFIKKPRRGTGITVRFDKCMRELRRVTKRIMTSNKRIDNSRFVTIRYYSRMEHPIKKENMSFPRFYDFYKTPGWNVSDSVSCGLWGGEFHPYNPMCFLTCYMTPCIDEAIRSMSQAEYRQLYTTPYYGCRGYIERSDFSTGRVNRLPIKSEFRYGQFVHTI